MRLKASSNRFHAGSTTVILPILQCTSKIT